MNEISNETILGLVGEAFAKADIAIARSSIRRFPGEVIVVVEVNDRDFSDALVVATDLNSQIPDGFVTIKKALIEEPAPAATRLGSLLDPRVNSLIEVLNARSRTSEQQPSLRYVLDAAQNLNIAASRRHHLIFGRRGVGKTALMLEAKKLVERRGATTFWMNVQTMRNLPAQDAFLTTAARLCDIPAQIHLGRSNPPFSVQLSRKLHDQIAIILGGAHIDRLQVRRIIPELHQLFNRLGHETGEDIYLFLDDIHYLSANEQPIFLDTIHSISRDNPIWIKAAGIRHQSRWFSDNPPTGLQTGHDAAIINLDVTLEQPAKAKKFLADVLNTYTDQAKLRGATEVISRSALDRLVLASGGVPRDFLVLSATAIQVARQRANAKSVGVQDVNEAAGQNAQLKIQELEDDAASSIGKARSRTDALNILRKFLLEEKQFTFFRLDFRDKEERPKEYELVQSEMDLRLIHLINAGLSDERHAGQRSEVYMLDLSQFSGIRFRRNLNVLDFTKDYLVLKYTGDTAPPRPGDTPRKLLSILRRGPVFELSKLDSLI